MIQNKSTLYVTICVLLLHSNTQFGLSPISFLVHCLKIFHPDQSFSAMATIAGGMNSLSLIRLLLNNVLANGSHFTEWYFSELRKPTRLLLPVDHSLFIPKLTVQLKQCAHWTSYILLSFATQSHPHPHPLGDKKAIDLFGGHVAPTALSA